MEKETITLEQMKNECIERLKIMKLSSKIIKDYIDKDKIYCTIISENRLLEVTNYAEARLALGSFELNKDKKVYHIISAGYGPNSTIFILYISNNIDEWSKEKSDLKKGFTEVISLKEELCKKIIGIETRDGKVVKVN